MSQRQKFFGALLILFLLISLLGNVALSLWGRYEARLAVGRQAEIEALRQELEDLGWHFRTKTDTEVLLKAYLQYGKDCLNKLNGMFAFVIYDSQEQSLFLARDRVGIKPLYYGF